MSGYYRESVICENGHRISYSNTPGEKFDPYCSKCGSPTTNKCLECGTTIKGKYYNPSILDLRGYDSPIPFYCTVCSSEYPWTSKLIENSNMVLQMDSNISDDDKNKLQEDIPKLVKDTPDAKIAAYNFKEIMKSANPSTVDMFKDIFINLVSDILFKIMFS